MDDVVTVPLTQGKEAIIDARFAADVLALKWHARKNHQQFYASHNSGFWPDGKRKPQIQLHRFVYELAYGPIPPGMQIDHINANALDNRLDNLRLATPRLNASNRMIHRQGKLVGVGYSARHHLWRAYRRIDDRMVTIGWFHTQAEAHSAYRKALQERPKGQEKIDREA